MLNTRSAALALGALALCAASTASAQQGDAISALYDTQNPVTLVGEIVDVEWVAPRARLHVVDEATAKRWVIVGGSPYDLTAEQRASVRVGERAQVVAYPTRDGLCAPSCNAFGETFLKADGAPLVSPPLPPHDH